MEEANQKEEVVLFTGCEVEQVLLSVEKGSSAFIDTACTSTVCRLPWYRDNYTGKSKTERGSSKFPRIKSFEFGDEKVLKSIKCSSACSSRGKESHAYH